MMWSLLRHSLCVMLYRLHETINIFDITNAKEEEAHMYLKKTRPITIKQFSSVRCEK